VALEEAVGGRLMMLPLPDAPIGISYWLATRTGSASPLVRQFTELLQAHTARLLTG
jgi:DNA-binding transcriptional LysR family regulator